MKNAALTILSLALAAAVVFGVVSRKNLVETKDSLQTERASRLAIEKDLESTRKDFDESASEMRWLQAELSRVEETEAAMHGQLGSLEKPYQEQTALLRDEVDSMKAQRDEMEAEISAIHLECDSKTAMLEASLRSSTEEIASTRECAVSSERRIQPA